jgi:hypothetical protein
MMGRVVRAAWLRWAWCLAVVVGLGLSGGGAWAESEWEVLSKEGGITVKRQEVEGREMPVFQGEAVVDGNLLEVLAVLSDTKRNAEWMHSCREAKLLDPISEVERVIYNRTAAPWPVDDRDVVLHTKAQIEPEKKRVTIRFHAIQSKLKGEVEGVVRMPRLQGFYQLTAVSEEKTRVRYQVDADPGGLLPAWVAEKASSEIPRNTLTNLRQQVKATRGQYDDTIKRWTEMFPELLKEGMEQLQKDAPKP